MKKILAVCLLLTMMMSLCVSVFADPGAFYVSPSKKPAPTLISFTAADDSCTADLIITPYIDRKSLPADLLALIEKAYGEIRGTTDLTTLHADLAKLATDLGIKGTDLAVSDLFDMQMVGCDADHDIHGPFTITLSADLMKNFACLLHMDHNGEWELCDATVNGDQVTFTIHDFSPFAIVVRTDGDGQQTGDMTALYAVLMAASAVAMAVVIVVSKKSKKQEA